MCCNSSCCSLRATEIKEHEGEKMSWKMWNASRNDLITWCVGQFISFNFSGLPAYVASPWLYSTYLKRTTTSYIVCTIRCLFSSNRPDDWNPVSFWGPTAVWLCQKPHRSKYMMPPTPPSTQSACCSTTGLDWLLPKLERKCANLQPDPGEGRSQEQAFWSFHQSYSSPALDPGSFRVEAQLN